jgi:hypothetical protein
LVTQIKVRKPKNIFWSELKYFVGFFIRQGFSRDGRLKFEENLYLHYITDTTYVTSKVTVDAVLLHFVCGTSILSAQQ